MKIIYTLHAQEKLKRKDVKRLGITKTLLGKLLKDPEVLKYTKYKDRCAISTLNDKHDVRIIYDIIGKDIKVITFHISKKGRYR